MKKTLLSLAVMATVSLCGFAANEGWPVIPAEGVINLENSPGGLSSIELNVSVEINRTASGYATISRDGDVLKSVPASNERLIYCFEGFDKVEKGMPHITFFNNQATTPAKEPGNYTVTIPRGFFTNSKGEENPQLVYNYTIEEDKSLKIIVDPADGSRVEEFSKATFTFPEGSTVEYIGSGESGITIELLDISGANEDETADPTPIVTVDGNVVTVSIDEAVTEKTRVWITSNAGAFNVTLADGSTLITPLFYSHITVIGKQQQTTGEYKITPAPGTYPLFKPEDNAAALEKENSFYTYFKIDFPEGLELKNPLRARCYLTNESGSNAATFTINKSPDGKSAYLSIIGKTETAEDLIVVDGTYNITITGTWWTTNGNSDPVDLSFGPYVIEAENPIVCEMNPKDGATLGELSEITLSFPEAKEVVWNPTEWATIISGAIQYDLKGKTEGTKIVIKIANPIDIPGDYELTIPTNAITVDGKNYGVKAIYHIDHNAIEDLNVEAINGTVGECKYVEEDDDYYAHWSVTVSFDKEEGSALKFIIPEGFDSFAYINNSILVEEPTVRRITSAELTAADYTINTTGIIDDLKEGTNLCSISFGSEDSFVEPTFVIIEVSGLSGISTVETISAAEFYTLQGTKVKNPENGIFIMVKDGKACKISVR